jgi:hypothetical protein
VAVFGDREGGGVTHTSLAYTGSDLFIYEEEFYII